MSRYRVVYLFGPLALLGAATLGAATVASAQSTTTTTTTTTTIEKPIGLTPQQRTVIYRTVTRERRTTRDSRAAPPGDIEVRLGAPVPPTVELSPLPDTVYAQVPTVRPLRYFYINNQLVLVDPATSQVIEIIDR